MKKSRVDQIPPLVDPNSESVRTAVTKARSTTALHIDNGIMWIVEQEQP